MTDRSSENGARDADGRPWRSRRRWRDQSTARKVAILVMAVAQLALAGTAWRDLARRPSSEVRGPKWRWALLIGVNWIGPTLYFWRGRRRPAVS